MFNSVDKAILGVVLSNCDMVCPRRLLHVTSAWEQSMQLGEPPLANSEETGGTCARRKGGCDGRRRRVHGQRRCGGARNRRRQRGRRQQQRRRLCRDARASASRYVDTASDAGLGRTLCASLTLQGGQDGSWLVHWRQAAADCNSRHMHTDSPGIGRCSHEQLRPPAHRHLALRQNIRPSFLAKGWRFCSGSAWRTARVVPYVTNLCRRDDGGSLICGVHGGDELCERHPPVVLRARARAAACAMQHCLSNFVQPASQCAMAIVLVLVAVTANPGQFQSGMLEGSPARHRPGRATSWRLKSTATAFNIATHLTGGRDRARGAGDQHCSRYD